MGEPLDPLRDQLRLLMEQSRVPTAVTRFADERILFVNPALQRAVGCFGGDIVGKTTYEIDLWADRDRHAVTIQQLKQSGSARGMRERLRRTDGSGFDVMTSAEVVALDDERCVLALFYDGSDRARADEEMRLYGLVLEARGSEPNKEILNRARVNELAEVTGKEWFSDFVASCLTDVSANVDKLLSAMRDGDTKVVCSIAHTLAGTTGTLGATRFAWLCQEVEEEARGAGDSARITPEDVERAWARLRVAWKEEFARRNRD